jgi:DinB superfamily
MSSSVRLLHDQWDRSCVRLLRRLDGLTDDEYRWEPVAGCWNVRPGSESPSGWTVDYPDVHPDPPPVTTIAWRLLHTSDGNTIYWDHSFGPGLRNFWDLAPHGDAAGAIEYLAESQRPVSSTLARMSDDLLDATCGRHTSVSRGRHTECSRRSSTNRCTTGPRSRSCVPLPSTRPRTLNADREPCTQQSANDALTGIRADLRNVRATRQPTRREAACRETSKET